MLLAVAVATSHRKGLLVSSARHDHTDGAPSPTARGADPGTPSAALQLAVKMCAPRRRSLQRREVCPMVPPEVVACASCWLTTIHRSGR
jgi:hypothetical protein